MKKKLLALLLAVVLCFTMLGCEELDEFLEEEDWDLEELLEEEEGDTELIGTSGDPNQTWAIYWYLCGSDLESESGFATGDMEEMMEAELPDNVQVVIETGGAWQWNNDQVDPSLLERYVYSSEGLELVDQQPLANMGDPNTLADFLDFCSSNYPADRTMVVFWNHGGGSVSGVSFDENFAYDSLTLDEMYQAFSYVYGSEPGGLPFDIIGFDACLMGTIDTAAAFSEFGRYLVASEELEPGGGWDYAGMLQALADDPGMDGARMGQVICDTYYDDCGWLLEDDVTLSVVDLSRIDPLLNAYENMGVEALTYALEDPYFFSEFGRMADKTENYGGNTRDEGYTNMVDLGHLAENCSGLLPETSQAIMDGLEHCVLYQVKGAYRENASGLSCYYSYNNDVEDFYGYLEQGCSDTFKYLYDYSIEGNLPPEGMEYISSDLGYEEETLPDIPDLEEDGWDEYPVYIDDEGYAVLELDQDIVNMLRGVYFQLAYVDPEEDIMLLLGRDNNLQSDWDNGIFRDNFSDVWGAIDGYLVYMEVTYEADDYTAFSVPILLNGEEYNLRVIYDYNDEKYYIAGARKGLEDNGMADKNLVQLCPGDEITTIHYACSLSGDDDFEAVEMDTFTVTESTSFEEVDMGDGSFIMMFEMEDAKGNVATSQLVQFDVEGEYIETSVLE